MTAADNRSRCQAARMAQVMKTATRAAVPLAGDRIRLARCRALRQTVAIEDLPLAADTAARRRGAALRTAAIPEEIRMAAIPAARTEEDRPTEDAHRPDMTAVADRFSPRFTPYPLTVRRPSDEAFCPSRGGALRGKL
jgi:hypothetical protein